MVKILNSLCQTRGFAGLRDTYSVRIDYILEDISLVAGLGEVYDRKPITDALEMLALSPCPVVSVLDLIPSIGVCVIHHDCPDDRSTACSVGGKLDHER